MNNSNSNSIPSLKQNVKNYIFNLVFFSGVSLGLFISLGGLGSLFLKLAGSPSIVPGALDYQESQLRLKEGWVGEVQQLAYIAGTGAWFIWLTLQTLIGGVVVATLLMIFLECWLDIMYLIPHSLTIFSKKEKK